MCHAEGSRPPAPPEATGTVAEHGDELLRAADGNVFLAYRSVPEDPRRPNVVLLPDVRGLHDFYRALADRFAETGSTALAIDYYGRTAPDHVRDGDFDGFAHAGRLRPGDVAADVRAAIDTLAGPVYTVGFCLGGAASWTQSALDDRVAGAVGFYGRPVEARPFIPAMRAPLLVLAAGQDVLTAPDDVTLFDTELTDAGVPHQVVMYPDAPHSFFDGGVAGHEDACADAWRHVLSFVNGDRS